MLNLEEITHSETIIKLVNKYGDGEYGHFKVVDEENLIYAIENKWIYLGDLKNKTFKSYKIKPLHPTCLEGRDRIAFYANRSNQIEMFDFDKKCVVKKLQGHTDTITSLVIEGEFLYSGSVDKAIRKWNRKTGKCEKILFRTSSIWDLQIYKNHLYFACGGIYAGSAWVAGGKEIQCWDLELNKCVKVFNFENAINAFYVNGKRLYTISTEWDWDLPYSKIRMYDLESGKLLNTIRAGEADHLFVMQHQLYAISDHEIKVYDISPKKKGFSLPFFRNKKTIFTQFSMSDNHKSMV